MSWHDTVSEIIAEASTICDGLAGTRDAMLGLWLAISLAAPNVRDMYRGFVEEDLVADAAAMTLADVFAPVPPPPTRRTERELLRDVAVRLRALEMHAYNLYNGDPIRRASECLAKFRDKEAYLLLRSPLHRAAKTKDSFQRRGLARSRLIPTRIGDIAVSLVFPVDARGRQRMKLGAPLVMGAGLFPGMTYETEIMPDGFAISDMSSPGQFDRIADDIRSASTDQCAGVVYPELSINADVLARIQAHLSDGSWDASGISLIVAGSRHHVDDRGRRFNLATVLDGYGGLIAEHRKLFRYSEGSGPHEAIELGTELQVLVFDEALFAFGICLDFCSPIEDPPYLSLDVDFILVPSCGGDSTMRNHIDRSSDIMKLQRGRSFVVQQFYSPAPVIEPHPLGYVLARSEVEQPTLEEVRCEESWIVKAL